MTLVELMAAVRDALRNGDFKALDGIAQRIEAALPDVAALTREDVAALARMATENAQGLDAARQGVRSARRRLAEIAAAERGVTYDRNGARAGHSNGAASLRF